MARNGIQRYTTRQECLAIIRALREQTDQIMLDLADKIEEFAREKFDGWKPPERKPIRRSPECNAHRLPCVYNQRTDEWDCPIPGCGFHAYEDDEPRGEGAEVYHQEVTDRSRDAAHGSSAHGRKRKKFRPARQNEGSMNAKKIPLIK